MVIDLSNISPWIWIIAALVIGFIILRFFSHIVARLFHLAFRFFWLGCISVVVLVILYVLLRALGVI